jgi:hypothetical protein
MGTLMERFVSGLRFSDTTKASGTFVGFKPLAFPAAAAKADACRSLIGTPEGMP